MYIYTYISYMYVYIYLRKIFDFFLSKVKMLSIGCLRFYPLGLSFHLGFYVLVECLWGAWAACQAPSGTPLPAWVCPRPGPPPRQCQECIIVAVRSDEISLQTSDLLKASLVRSMISSGLHLHWNHLATTLWENNYWTILLYNYFQIVDFLLISGGKLIAPWQLDVNV